MHCDTKNEMWTPHPPSRSFEIHAHRRNKTHSLKKTNICTDIRTSGAESDMEGSFNGSASCLTRTAFVDPLLSDPGCLGWRMTDNYR